MRVPTKIINLMGGEKQAGGACFDLVNNLYVSYNDVNKLVKVNFSDPFPGASSVMFSANALGYEDFCTVRSQTFYYGALVDQGIIFLLKNGEVVHKSLRTFQETRWPANSSGESIPYPSTAPYPPLRGASGIEYHDDALFVTMPQYNQVWKVALVTLAKIAEYPMGVPIDTPYPPAALSWDGVNTRWATIDPVKGDIVYGDALDFHEGGRERYTYGIFGDCFTGDIAWAKTALPGYPGKDFFVTAFKNQITAFMEPWYKLYEVNDNTGEIREVDGINYDNVEVGGQEIKHLRLENMTPTLRQGMVIGIVPDPTITADDDLHLSISPAGPWSKTIALGDFPGLATVDLWMRFYPSVGTIRGVYNVQLSIDFGD